MWGNLALSIFDLDASSMFKKIYDSALGDYKGAVLLDNGFLQVTMDDGTIYARPFLPNAHGSLFGDTKDDVIFGGNGNDEFYGSSEEFSERRDITELQNSRDFSEILRSRCSL